MSEKLLFNEFDQPENVLEIATVPESELAEGHVRVRMIAAPINPADINFVQGIYGIRPSLPASPGLEGCGEVIESRTDNFSVGDRVVFIDWIGTWAEEIICPASALLCIPSETPPLQAAMLKVNPLTAWCMLTDLTQLNEGDWVIQNAANSGVGCCVIQIAKLLGLKTINLVRRKELLDELNELGGDINLLDDPESIDAIREKKPLLALNAVGGDSALRLMDALDTGGLHVTYGAMSRRSLKVPNKFLIFKGIQIHGFWMTEWLGRQSAERIQQDYQRLAQWMVDDQLSQPIDSVYSLHEFQDAVSRAQESKRSGKIMFKMNE